MPFLHLLFTTIPHLFQEIFYPTRCLGCGADGTYLCHKCQAAFPKYEKHHCLFCHYPTLIGETCSGCARTKALDGCTITYDYHHPLLKKTLHYYKYKYVQELHLPLAREMSANEETSSIISRGHAPGQNSSKEWARTTFTLDPTLSWLIIPIPLHRKRLSQRGFNQAELLALALSKSNESYMLRSDILTRMKNTTAQGQKRLHKDERTMNMKHAFAVLENKKADLEGQNLLLIDDVTTSGTTLEEAAQTLKQAGAQCVWGWVAAHES